MTKQVTIVTDGSCLGNPGPGGWAAVLKFGEHKKLISGGVEDTTNNRMELTALVEALKQLKESCSLKIVTDSQYLMNAFTKKWLDNWIRKNWKTSGGKAVKNVDLWQELMREIDNHDYEFEWVRGHSGHPDNEAVDKAAREEAGRLKKDKE